MTCSEQLKAQVQSCAESIEDAVNGIFDDEECEDAIEKYFEDALDAEFVIGIDGHYRGARIALALGGPGVFLDTRTGFVEGYWSGDYAEYYIPSNIVEAVDEYFSELYEMTRY